MNLSSLFDKKWGFPFIILTVHIIRVLITLHEFGGISLRTFVDCAYHTGINIFQRSPEIFEDDVEFVNNFSMNKRLV